MARSLVAVAIAALASCAPGEIDQLMVHVVDGTDRGLSVPEDLDAFEIRVATVREGEEDLVRWNRVIALAPSVGRVAPDAVRLPQTLAIVPGRESSGTVRIVVLGLRHARPVQRIERIASFGVGRIDLPPFVLTPLCFGVMCPDGQTCGPDGRCTTTMGTPDAGVPRDAGPCGPLFVDCSGTCIPYDDANCGACGNACATDQRCVSNVCTCGVGLVACGGPCVDLATDPMNCGTCGNACSAASATSSCSAGACVITGCAAGRANCDGSAANGCETQLGTDGNCSGCGDACDISHGVGACVGGDCMLDRCDGGWADCDGSDGNGCETRLGTSSDCSGCRDDCSLPNAASSCSGGGCVIDSCNAGWADCSGGAGNGCETQLGTDSDCNGCGDRCVDGEGCMGGDCSCLNNGHWEDVRGPCLPSCGVLSGRAGRVGECCGSACSTSAIGGTWASYDCMLCCDGAGTCI